MHLVADDDFDVNTIPVMSARVTSWLEGQQFFLVWMALKRRGWIQMKRRRTTQEKGFLVVELLGVDLSQQIPANSFSLIWQIRQAQNMNSDIK